MESTSSSNAKPNNTEPLFQLTQPEIESLRREMHLAHNEMRELSRALKFNGGASRNVFYR